MMYVRIRTSKPVSKVDGTMTTVDWQVRNNKNKNNNKVVLASCHRKLPRLGPIDRRTAGFFLLSGGVLYNKWFS